MLAQPSTVDEFVKHCRRLGNNAPRGAGRFFGRWVGRPMDGDLKLDGVRYLRDTDELVLRFKDGEKVTLKTPSGFEVGAGVFRVANAQRVCFEWFDVGVPHEPQHQQRFELERPADATEPAFEIL